MTRRIVILILLLLIMAIPAATYGLIASETGARWLLGLTSRMGGERISFEYLSGTLVSPIEVAQIEYREGGRRIHIDRMALTWRPLGLLNGTVHIERLAMKRVSYQAGAGDAPGMQPKGTFQGIQLPVAIRADEIDIETLHLVPQSSRKDIGRIRIRDLRGDGDTLSIAGMDVKGEDFSLSSRASMAAAAPHAVEATFAWSYRLPHGASASGNGDISGNLELLKVSHRLSAPFSAALEGTLSPLASPPSADLRLEWQHLRWPLQGAGELRSELGKILLEGNANALRLALDASLTGEGLPVNHVRIDADGGFADNDVNVELLWAAGLVTGDRVAGRGRITGSNTRLALEHSIREPVEVSTQGEVVFTANTIKLAVGGNWRNLRWPLSGDPELTSASGRYRVDGPLDLLSFGVDGEIESQVARIKHAELHVEGHVVADSPFAFDTEINWKGTFDNAVDAAGRARIVGDSERVRIEKTIEYPLALEVTGDVALNDKPVALHINGHWRDAQWPLKGEPKYASSDGEFSLQGPVDGLELISSGSVRGPNLPPAHARMEAHLRPSGANIRSLLIETLGGEIHIGGEYSMEGKVSAVRMHGRWRDLRWPHSGPPEYVSKTGEFNVTGAINDFELTFDADVGGSELPAARALVDAQIQPTGANVRSLLIQTLGGDIRVRGDVGWNPSTTWRLDVDAAGLNPAVFAADWPGDVSLEARVSGNLVGDVPRIGIDLNKLSGHLRGYPLRGEGSLTVDGPRVAAKDLVLASGENSLRLKGEAGEQMDIGFVVDAPSLGAFAPQLRGSLTGSGALTGTRALPLISANLTGSALAWRNNQVQALSVNLDAGADPAHPSKFNLNADGVRILDTTIERLTADGTGNPDAHRLQFTAVAEDGKLFATVDGNLVDKAWSGIVDSNLSTKSFGDWRLEQPVPVQVSREKISVARTCLVQAPAEICANGEWRAANDSVRAEGEIRSLPLALAAPFLPKGIHVDGPIGGEFSVDGETGATEATARLLANGGTISYRHGTEPARTEFRFHSASLDVRHLPTGVHAQLEAALENAGRVKGVFDIGIAEGDVPAPLRGRLDADFTDLSWLGVLLPQATEIGGELKAGLDVGGTTAQPAVTGEAALRDGQANLPDLGLSLRQIHLSLRNRSADQFVIEGGIASGGGGIDFHGESNLTASGLQQLDLVLKGQNFEVARLPTVHAFASPQLRLRADGGVAELTGQIHIPRAKIQLKELPESAVAVSGDEVIVGRDVGERDENRLSGPKTRIMVDVTLGKEVEFDGFGLTAGIDGKLAMSGESGQALNAQGDLSLRDGRYDAYGQQLDIQRGRLLFTGPVDNPDIDVIAVREIGDVTAGIAISGKIRSIQSRVYSDPPLPDADAFSYLLTGRPLSGGTKSDAEMLSGAAVSLGLQRSQLVTRQIGASVGLDELTVGGDDVARSSLLLGKQITPDLFVRYALGLFDQSGKLLLNYRLTDSLSLEAESGAQQGVDLIYQIERDQLF